MLREFLKLFTITHYTFEGKKDYENVIALLYRHWFTLFLKLFFFLFLAALPVILEFFFGYFLESFGLKEIYTFLVSIYFLIWWAGLFYALTMYLLDTWIVTDHRLLDSEQHGFFRRTLAEMNLAKLQDIAVSVKGFFPTILDYGNVEIQTAGAIPKLVFKQVPQPGKIKEAIVHIHNVYAKEHPGDLEVHEKGI